MAVDCMSRRMLESRKDAQELVCNLEQLFVYNFGKEREREKRASVKVIVFFLTVICSTESSLRPVVLWVAIKKEAIVKTEDLYYVRSSKALFTCLHHFVEKFSYEIVM